MTQPEKQHQTIPDSLLTTTSNTYPNSNRPTIRCLYTNATSLNNKWDELKSRLVAENFPHLLLITETWFAENSINNINNYTLFSKHRPLKPGGGVAIYARNDIHAVEANHLIKPAEQIWCSILVSKRETILVGCIYRPLHTLHELNLDIINSIQVACELVARKKFTSLLITGDFNYSDIDWSSSYAIAKGKGRPTSNDFIDLLRSTYLHQHVRELTFGRNVLDLVLSNSQHNIYAVKVSAPLGGSTNNCYHAVLTWDLLIASYPQKANIARSCWKNGDICTAECHPKFHQLAVRSS